MKKAMIFSAAIFAIEIILILILLPTLPEEIPIHWNLMGQPDNWTKKRCIIFAPIIGFMPVLSLYFTLCVAKSRHIKNLPTEKPASIGIIATKLIFTLILVSVLFNVGGLSSHSFTSDRVTFTICGFGLIVLGGCLPRIKQNPVIGVRTKWTLKSERVWKKTSILCGFLLIINGVTFLLCQILLPDTYNLFVPLAVLVLVVPIIYIYSRLLYKKNERTN